MMTTGRLKAEWIGETSEDEEVDYDCSHFAPITKILDPPSSTSAFQLMPNISPK